MTSTVPNSDELIERVNRGDLEASERLFAAHRDRLHALIAARLDRRVQARVDPSDVVQETLAAASEALPEYLRNRPLPFFAWLRQIAWERLIKLHRHHLRAQRRSVTREARGPEVQREESELRLSQAVVASGTSPSQKLMREESRLQILEALAQVPASDRQLITMRYVDRLALADIAAALKISVGAAKVRHLRALRRLAAIMQQDGTLP